MIDVIRAGVLTPFRTSAVTATGISASRSGGALDRLSLEVGNRLVGNRPDAAGLEITFGPTVLRFLRATRVAITGTEFGATLDGKPVYSWWSLPVQAGQELTLRCGASAACAATCAWRAASTSCRCSARAAPISARRFGGLGGRALRDGDRLPVGVPPQHGHLRLHAGGAGVRREGARLVQVRAGSTNRCGAAVIRRASRGPCRSACCAVRNTTASPTKPTNRSGTMNGRHAEQQPHGLPPRGHDARAHAGKPTCCRTRCCRARFRCRRTASRSC